MSSREGGAVACTFRYRLDSFSLVRAPGSLGLLSRDASSEMTHCAVFIRHYPINNISVTIIECYTSHLPATFEYVRIEQSGVSTPVSYNSPERRLYHV